MVTLLMLIRSAAVSGPIHPLFLLKQNTGDDSDPTKFFDLNVSPDPIVRFSHFHVLFYQQERIEHVAKLLTGAGPKHHCYCQACSKYVRVPNSSHNNDLTKLWIYFQARTLLKEQGTAWT